MQAGNPADDSKGYDMAQLTKRQAIAEVRALADAVIEQRTRQAQGWDKGAYRDDDIQQLCTIERRMRGYAYQAIVYAKQHASA